MWCVVRKRKGQRAKFAREVACFKTKTRAQKRLREIRAKRGSGAPGFVVVNRRMPPPTRRR